MVTAKAVKWDFGSNCLLGSLIPGHSYVIERSSFTENRWKASNLLNHEVGWVTGTLPEVLQAVQDNADKAVKSLIA